MLTLIPIPAFRDNYIWLLHDRNGDALVVDPGDADAARRALQQHGLALQAILVTHHHPDHVGGIPALLADRPVPVYGPGTESIPGCSHPVGEGDELTLEAPAIRFRVLSVPGHTLGHVAYASDDAENGLLFCGDTLFSGGCGRLFEGTPAQMLTSLDRLAALPDDTRVCCAHEYTAANLAFALHLLPDDPSLLARQQQVEQLRHAGLPSLPTSLDEERRSNLFLRCDEPAVARALGVKEPADRLSVFTALRARKDHF